MRVSPLPLAAALALLAPFPAAAQEAGETGDAGGWHFLFQPSSWFLR